MPIKMYWYIKDKVIFMEMISVVSEEEYAMMICTSPANQPNAPLVHTILSGEKLTSAHDSMPSMKFMGSQKPENGNNSWVLFIQHQNSSVGKFIVSVTMQLIKMKFRFVSSWQEAIDTLAKVDSTLPSMTIPASVEDLEVLDYIDLSPEKIINPNLG